MQVHGLDHINILTRDLDASARFYCDVVGLNRAASPGSARGMQGAWMCDASGRAIVHVVLYDPEREYGAGHAIGEPTGAIHHIALRCSGFAEAQERVAQSGWEHRVNNGIAGLFQILLTDPSGITVELNFPDD